MAIDYCTTADVQALVTGFTIDATSKPSIVDVDKWIKDVSAELDGVLLSADYPEELDSETHPKSNKILCRLCSLEVACRVLLSSHLAQNEAAYIQADKFHEMYEEGTKKMRSELNYLPDAYSEGAGGGTRPHSWQQDNPNLDAGPNFTMSEDF